MSDIYHEFIDKFHKQIELVQKKVQSNLSEQPNTAFGKFVTVARDPGSGGKPIAQQLAKKLNYEFYDDRLLREVASSAKLRKDIIERVDERQRTLVQDIVHQLMNPDYVSEQRYLKHLYRVVLSLAHKGNVVLLGRGTNFIVPRGTGFHVRITAPYRICVARAVKYEGVDYQKARDIIREVTAERAGFVKQYFGKEIKNPKYYDLTINTQHYTVEETAQLIELAYTMRYAPKKKL